MLKDQTNHFDHTNDRLPSTLDHPSCFSCRCLDRNYILLLDEYDASVWVLEVVAVVAAQLEKKVEAVEVQTDHLEDLGNTDAFDSLLGAPPDVENDEFPFESVMK